MNDHRFKRVLVIAPHADDAELGVGGLLARIAHNGSEAKVVIMAIGQTSREINPDNRVTITARQRQDETINAMKVLGVDDYTVYSDRDGCLYTTPMRDAVAFLDHQIDNFNPTAIFIPLPSYHQDHKFTFEAGMAAIRPNPSISQVPIACVYEYPMNAVDYNYPFNSRIYLDISGLYKESYVSALGFTVNDTTYLDQKIRAYECHKSQQERDTTHLLHPESIRDLARVRGRECGCMYAERYYLIREILRLE